MEELELINPFGIHEAKKVVDENRKSHDWWLDYIALNEPLIENEFYALFADGLLVKKGRSKFKTSQYLKNEKFLTIKQYYYENKEKPLGD